MNEPKPQLSWEYIGDQLAIFWTNPYYENVPYYDCRAKEKIASFWWPFHPGEKTKEVEDLFEAMAQTLVNEWNKKTQ